MTDVVLTGPVVLPGDSTPVAGCDVKVLLIAGSPRDPGDNGSAAVLGEYATRTDNTGDFTVTVPAIDADFYPPGAFYAVTVGGHGRFKGYVRKIQPTVAGTFRFTDPDIGGTDLLPPEFTQIDPSTDDIVAAVNDYLANNPFDVSAEVAAELVAHPPLFVDNNLSELTATQATARLNIGAASDTEMAADHIVFDNRIGSLELLESTSHAVRAPGFTSVDFTVNAEGVVAFIVDGEGITDPDVGSLYMLAADVATAGKGYVFHGAVAGRDRPEGFASVEWHGSVEPNNWIDGDTWVAP